VSLTAAHANGPRLLEKPTLSKTHIAFAYAGDFWIVPRESGDALPGTSATPSWVRWLESAPGADWWDLRLSAAHGWRLGDRAARRQATGGGNGARRRQRVFGPEGEKISGTTGAACG